MGMATWLRVAQRAVLAFNNTTFAVRVFISAITLVTRTNKCNSTGR